MNNISICIPNYNYDNFINLTIESVLNQDYKYFEINVCDNNSTDKSVEVVSDFIKKDKRISLKINKSNVGFSGNLDRVCQMAKNDWMILLSSDDIMINGALKAYNKFIDLIDDKQNFAFSSSWEKIDSNGNKIRIIKPLKRIWNQNDIDTDLTKKMGFKVFKVKSSDMLNRCLRDFDNPFNFASTCFLKNNYEQVGGYGGGRTYNPDKWFHWKLLSVTDFVYFLDAPFFQYRWHENNQASIQNKSKILKYWVDEYRNCFELDNNLLKASNLSKSQVETNFNNHLIKHIFRAILDGDSFYAKRLYHFGASCFPLEFRKRYYFILIPLIIIFTPVLNFISNYFLKNK